tara:strand:- start:248 stop:1078 length:831 start_codon:yes stop_codon:yes gene_type:complete
LFEPIQKILNHKKFKEEIFNGKIFVFKKSTISLNLIKEIKSKINQKYNGELDKLHLLDNFEEISSKLVANLKNTKIFLNLFREFLEEINFYKGDSYWDKFVVRVAPAENKFSYREASRIKTHRDTWGTNIHQQINWWAPISNIDETNTMIFYPEYFSKPVENSTSSWDLDIYLANRKRGDFSYPSAPQLEEDLPKNVKILPVTIKPGEILCFSGCHLHSSSKESSDKTRFSYEIRTVCQVDIDNNNVAPNTDCDLRFQFPKIFRHIDDNSPLKLSS